MNLHDDFNYYHQKIPRLDGRRATDIGIKVGNRRIDLDPFLEEHLDWIRSIEANSTVKTQIELHVASVGFEERRDDELLYLVKTIPVWLEVPA